MTQATSMLFATAFTVLFGAIYEHFSHGVYSYYMIYSFAPLLIAAIVYLLHARFSKDPPGALVRNLYTAFSATAAVGMTAQGVVIIYGSTNKLTIAYLTAASLLLILTAIARLMELHKLKKSIPAINPEPPV